MTDDEFTKNKKSVEVAPYALYDTLHELIKSGCRCAVSKEDERLVIHFARITDMDDRKEIAATCKVDKVAVLEPTEHPETVNKKLYARYLQLKKKFEPKREPENDEKCHGQPSVVINGPDNDIPPLELNARLSVNGYKEYRCWKCNRWKPASQFTDEVYLTYPPKYMCLECAGQTKKHKEPVLYTCTESIHDLRFRSGTFSAKDTEQIEKITFETRLCVIALLYAVNSDEEFRLLDPAKCSVTYDVDRNVVLKYQEHFDGQQFFKGKDILALVPDYQNGSVHPLTAFPDGIERHSDAAGVFYTYSLSDKAMPAKTVVQKNEGR